MYGTRKKFLNTEIEPHIEALNEINVVKVTTLEPFDKKIIAELGDKFNIHHKIVLVMKQSTQVYYNMRIVLGLRFG